MAIADLLGALRSVLDSDARVEAAFLFGSAARDALRDDSDVDVGVRWASDAERIDAVREFLDIVGRLGQVSGRDVHLVDLSRAGPELRRRVYTEGVQIVDRNPRRTREELVHATIEVIDWEYARRVRRASLATRLGATDG